MSAANAFYNLGKHSAPRNGPSKEGVPTVFGRIVLLVLINGFATSRTKSNMNPPTAAASRVALREISADTNMRDPHFEHRSGFRSGNYGRWPDPWRREDDWGPITAAVMFFIMLAGVIVCGIGVHL